MNLIPVRRIPQEFAVPPLRVGGEHANIVHPPTEGGVVGSDDARIGPAVAEPETLQGVNLQCLLVGVASLPSWPAGLIFRWSQLLALQPQLVLG